MSDYSRHALIARLVRAMRNKDSWTARTQIHKSLFALQVLFSLPEQLALPFTLYRHGAYSFELDQQIREMEFYDALRPERHLHYGPRYVPTSGGEMLIEKHGPAARPWQPAIDFIANRVSTKNVRQLEALSTVMWVSTEEHGDQRPDKSAIIVRVRELKPHLGEQEVDAAYVEFLRLREEAARISTPAAA